MRTEETPGFRLRPPHILVAASVALVVFTILALYLASREDAPAGTDGEGGGERTTGAPLFLYEIQPPEGSPFRPRGATIQDDKAYVAESEGGRVAVLDLAAGAGAELTFIPIAPEEPGEELPGRPQPTGVAFLSDGSLAVADSANGRIWKVGRDGSFLGELVDSIERERSNLGSPVGLWATARELFVTDVSDHSLKVFTHSGRFLRRAGERGFRPGTFDFPNSVAAVSGGAIYVADSNNGRVQQLDPGGSPTATLESAGGEGTLQLPRGLAFDRFGRLHVVDTFGKGVYVYREQEFQMIYGRGGEGETPLDLPEGIAVSEERIVVADGGSRRLLVFGY